MSRSAGFGASGTAPCNSLRICQMRKVHRIGRPGIRQACNRLPLDTLRQSPDGLVRWKRRVCHRGAQQQAAFFCRCRRNAPASGGIWSSGRACLPSMEVATLAINR